MFWFFAAFVLLLVGWEIWLRRNDPPGPDFWN